MQEEVLKEKGLGRVKIVKLENTKMGVLGVIGYDEQGEKYRLLPSPKDPNLAVMAWPGNEGTDEMNM